MRTRFARDQSTDATGAVGTLTRARLEMRETLLLAGFSLPVEPEASVHVVCSYCAEGGHEVADVRHEDWCIYQDGPVCPDVPN